MHLLLRMHPAAATLAALLPATSLALDLRPDDRVVWIGNTFTERAQQNGHIETALTLAATGPVTFRNLGWSGDSVFCEARSYFGPPQEGFDRLQRAVTEIRPTVLLVCYGAMAAFEGPAGLERFTTGYDRLLAMLQEASGAREVVLVSPPPFENLGAPLPDHVETNRNLALYRDAIRDLALRRGLEFVDLFGRMGGGSPDIPDAPLTSNGIHYTDTGYARIAGALLAGLGLPDRRPAGFESDAAFNELRETVVGKNRLFFHRWRPANETYLFLFRKHEQGNNAREIPMFDPLITDQEAKIESLRSNLTRR